MIELEIVIQPKSIKYLEFSQSLKLIISKLNQDYKSLQVTEDNKIFSLIAKMDSPKQLASFLRTKELSILSGAIRTLGEKSEIIIHGLGGKKKSNDQKEIRFNYLRKKENNSIKLKTIKL